MEPELVLKDLKDEFHDSNIQFDYRKPPFFLQPFLKECDSSVGFLYKLKAKSRYNENHISSVCEYDSVSSICGQPLEAPYSEFESLNLSNSFEEDDNEADSHYPLTLTCARNVLSFCNLNIFPQFPIWILTDGADRNNTVLLSSEWGGSWNCRSWVMDKGFSGPVEMDAIITEHIRLSNSTMNMATYEARCCYDIQKEMLEDDPLYLHSQITLHALWSKACIEPPLLHRSTAIKLNIKVRMGHGKEGLLVMWKQLCLINSYIELIAKNSASGTPNTIAKLPSSADIMKNYANPSSLESPISCIRAALTEPMLSVICNDDSELTVKHLIKQFSFNDKFAADITDRLWLLFIQCNTYQELSACMKELLFEIKKKNIPTPFLSTSNISRLGIALLGGEGVHFHDSLEYLVEIGLEKLKKEILLIFSKAQIATANILNIPKFPNFSEISSSNWLSTARCWHLWLCQVYCSLEILWRVQDSLCLPNSALYSISPTILKFFAGKDSNIKNFNYITVNALQEVETAIPVKHVETVIRGKVSSEWFFLVSTANKCAKYQTGYLRTSKCLFPNICSKRNIEEDQTIFLDHFDMTLYKFQSVSQKLS